MVAVPQQTSVRADCTSLLCSSLCSSSSCFKEAAVLRSAASDCSRSATFRASSSSRRDSWAPCEAAQEVVTRRQEERLRSRSAKMEQKHQEHQLHECQHKNMTLLLLLNICIILSILIFFHSPPINNLQNKQRIRHHRLTHGCQTVARGLTLARNAIESHYWSWPVTNIQHMYSECYKSQNALHALLLL